MGPSLHDMLRTSAPLAETIAGELCEDSHTQKQSCEWYHGTWQYLRLLDLVSNPIWHKSFFENVIRDAVGQDHSILVSGTADYTILSVLLDALNKGEIQSSEITVLDTCRTPLALCEWYASENDIEITARKDDICDTDADGQFDLIITDAFLTRFPHETKQSIIDRWSDLLTNRGTIATTIRIKPDAKERGGTRNESPSSFANRAKTNAAEYTEFPKQPEKVGLMAKIWKENIQSYPVVSENEAIDIFSKFEWSKVATSVNYVPRETNDVTRYCQVVAEK